MVLDYQLVGLPFGAGLLQKTDDRSRPQPFLDVCRDVQFDELGGLQTRLPFGAGAGAIFGGGTIANARRIERYNNEIVLFTDTQLYSWNAQLGVWVLRGTHLAVKVTEEPRFTTPGDQVDGDRAELNGTVVYAWTEGTQVYAAAMDKTTASVLVAPTAVSTAVGRPKLVALLTKILLFTDAGANNLTVRAIDPATPGTAIAGAGTSALATNYNAIYDVVQVPSADTALVVARRVTTTSYSILKVTAGLVVTSATPARTCDGVIAIAVDSTATSAQIIRENGTNIQGDLVTVAGLADVFTGQAIGTVSGTPVNQVTAAFASTTCTAFWSFLETSDGLNAAFATKFNTVTTSNIVGTQAVFIPRLGIASRAFERSGSIYVWLAFGEDSAAVVAGTPLGIRAQLQNTYFLYRSDRLLVSKAAWQTAGGYSPSSGHLPGVAATSASEYAWLGAVRRVVDVGVGSRTAFGARSPRDIVATFDSNEARRGAQLGRTLYVSGGLVQQYDGFQLVELGAQVYPWSIAAQDSGVAGNVAVGTYNWKGTIGYTNGQGEKERSTTATGVQIAVAGAPHIVIIGYFPLYVTNKTSRLPNLEFWRTATLPLAASPYYKVTGDDPNTTAGDNPWIPNSTTTGGVFNDNYSDATLTTKEANPENDGFLENLAPPGASIIIATDTRLFLAGVPGDPHRVWYSKQRNDGEVAAFHEQLTVDVPRSGGDVTSIAFLQETLFVFRQAAIYALPGQGFDNSGDGQNFGPSRIISLDVGAVNHESVALTPQGLIFKSSKGWYMLSGAGAVEYIGDKVSDFDSESVLAVNVIEAQHQVRILTAARMLVWDYRANQWGEWTVSDGVHATMYQGAHVYLAATGTRTQQATYTGVTYGADVEIAWWKRGELQGAARVLEFLLLGEYRGSHALRIRTAYDYQQDGAGNWVYTDEIYWTPSPQIVGSVLQVARGLSRGRCQALKIRITASAPAKDGTPATTEAIKLTGLMLNVGFPKTPFKRLPAAQKV